MSGTLHIFRREVVNGGTFFQVNYNLPGRSFAMVLDGQHQLSEFLEVIAALPTDLVDAIWGELNRAGLANVADVVIDEGQAVGHGMKETPSDF